MGRKERTSTYYLVEPV